MRACGGRYRDVHVRPARAPLEDRCLMPAINDSTDPRARSILITVFVIPRPLNRLEFLECLTKLLAIGSEILSLFPVFA